MPKRFPKEFKDDVVRVARSGKFTHEEIAHDFQISVASVRRWLDELAAPRDLIVALRSTVPHKNQRRAA